MLRPDESAHRLVLRIVLPRPLREIKDELIWRTVQIFGTQKAAAQNLGITEATISRRLNRQRSGRGREK
jgi:DNA invertase Pin-like site-specific DNA recombinase